MTEYTTSSEAIREYLTSRERTARWVQQHYGHDIELLSPSLPPSILSDSDAPSYGPSDSEESDHSLPPRMILRWGDGRPDIPIPSSSNHTRSRSQSHSYPYRPRDMRPDDVVPPLPPAMHPAFPAGAGSHHPSAASVPSRHAQSLSYASGPLMGPPGHSTPLHEPEHIVVLPSPQDEGGPSAAPVASSHVSHHGSHYASRTPTAHSVHHPQPVHANGAYTSVPLQQPTIHAPSPRHAYNPSHVSQNATQSPAMQYTQSQPAPVSHGVYAPSSRHAGSNYAPPQIVYSPSHTHRGPAPSIAYSHSAPQPATQHHPHGGMGSIPHNVNPRGVVDSVRQASRAQSRGHGRSQSTSRAAYERNRSASRSDSPPLSEAGSRTSGSTYYVLPTPGQKVQIIQPGAPSIRTATTATKASQYSPHSADSVKKPFFQRIFHIPKFAPSVDSRTSSSSSGRKLRRRHTLAVGAHQRDHQ